MSMTTTTVTTVTMMTRMKTSRATTKITAMMTNDCSCNEYFIVDEYHDDYEDDLYNSGSNKNYDDKTTATLMTE